MTIVVEVKLCVRLFGHIQYSWLLKHVVAFVGRGGWNVLLLRLSDVLGGKCFSGSWSNRGFFVVPVNQLADAEVTPLVVLGIKLGRELTPLQSNLIIQVGLLSHLLHLELVPSINANVPPDFHLGYVVAFKPHDVFFFMV